MGYKIHKKSVDLYQRHRKEGFLVNYLHKGDPVLIVSMDVIKTEQYANQMMDPGLNPR
jgi:hypothetical protein